MRLLALVVALTALAASSSANSARVRSLCDNVLAVSRSDDSGLTFTPAGDNSQGGAQYPWGNLFDNTFEDVTCATRIKLHCTDQESYAGLLAFVDYNGNEYQTQAPLAAPFTTPDFSGVVQDRGNADASPWHAVISSVSCSLFSPSTCPRWVWPTESSPTAEEVRDFVIVVDFSTLGAAPTITCPANIEQNNDAGKCSAVVDFTITPGDDGCEDKSLSYQYSDEHGGYVSISGGEFPVGTTTVTATVTSGGHAASCEFNVTVYDNENPTVTCPANIDQYNDAHQCGAAVAFEAATTADNCGVYGVGYMIPGEHGPIEVASGDNFPVGTTTVTATVVDIHGNIATCEFNVTVWDNENPTITCPANVDQYNDAHQCNAVVSFDAATTADNCGVFGVSYIMPGEHGPVDVFSGQTVFPVGTSTVSATVVDINSNIAWCEFNVTVHDHENPTVTCPSYDVTANTDSTSCDAAVTFDVTAADNCAADLSLSSPSGSRFERGTHPVSATATDAAGNSDTCSFNVVVSDKTEPLVNCPYDMTVPTDLDTCHAQVGFSASATDNCDEPTLSYSPASGHEFPLGETTVWVTATDSSHNDATCQFSVMVEDKQAPSFDACPHGTEQIVYAPEGSCCAAAPLPPQHATDNCDGATCEVHASHEPGSIFCMDNGHNGGSSGHYYGGSHGSPHQPTYPSGSTVTYTAKDEAGNEATCSFTVTVKPQAQPKFSRCPYSTTVEAGRGSCWVAVWWTAPKASGTTGDCPTEVTRSHRPGSKFYKGTTTAVEYTATDMSGESVKCRFTVKVVDNKPPYCTP